MDNWKWFKLFGLCVLTLLSMVGVVLGIITGNAVNTLICILGSAAWISIWGDARGELWRWRGE